MESSKESTVVKVFQGLTLLVGALSFVCGIFGIYWGTKVIHLWPPTTWGSVVSGFFMMYAMTTHPCVLFAFLLSDIVADSGVVCSC